MKKILGFILNHIGFTFFLLIVLFLVVQVACGNKLPAERPWMTVEIYRDSLQLYLNGNRAILRDTQTIFNRKYTIYITKDR